MDRAMRIATLVVLVAIAVLLAMILAALHSVVGVKVYTMDGTPVHGVRIVEPVR
jgi:hypothetical protein